jgi:hypothetical protein
MSIAFVDESIRRLGSDAMVHILAALMVPPTAVDPVRASLRGRLRRGQRALHYRSEQPASRAAVAALVCGAHRIGVRGIVVLVVMEGPRATARARVRCLWGLATELSASGASWAVIESRQPWNDLADRRDLESIRRAGLIGQEFRYRHLRSVDEPCLWAADVLAGLIGDRLVRASAIPGRPSRETFTIAGLEVALLTA